MKHKQVFHANIRSDESIDTFSSVIEGKRHLEGKRDGTFAACDVNNSTESNMTTTLRCKVHTLF